MPPIKLYFADWNAERFILWAAQVGPSCKKVIWLNLDAAVHEQHAYRSCFGILELKDKFSPKRLKQACQLLLSRSYTPQYSQVKRILERKEDVATPEAAIQEQKNRKGSAAALIIMERNQEGTAMLRNETVHQL